MAVRNIKYCTIPSSTLIPPAELLLSEDLATTYNFILTEYDQDPRVPRGRYEGLKSPNEVRKILKIASLIATLKVSGRRHFPQVWRGASDWLEASVA